MSQTQDASGAEVRRRFLEPIRVARRVLHERDGGKRARQGHADATGTEGRVSPTTCARAVTVRTSSLVFHTPAFVDFPDPSQRLSIVPLPSLPAARFAATRLSRGRCGRPRRGVTLLELVIVLSLMGMAAAVVAPVLTRRALADERPDLATLTNARRRAVQRAEPLRFVMQTSRAWRLTSMRDAAIIDSGTLAFTASAHADGARSMDVTIDALGACIPARQASSIQLFDPLSCAAPGGPMRGAESRP